MPSANPEYVREVQRIVAASPYPSHMSMGLTEMDISSSTVELALNNNHMQPFGIVHGGVLATLIDTATFWAAFMAIPQDAGLVNVDLKLNYLKPVTDGLLRARGRALHSGKSISYAEASVFDENNTLLSHGTSTLMTIPGKGLAINVPKFL